MTKASYNLVDEPWIPVTLAADFPGRFERGPAPRVSLREAFEQGECIVDLRCYPHERIALMRLLICVAQRALNGPVSEEEWQACRGDLAKRAAAYLEQHRPCFNLFGDGRRFLQAHGRGEPGLQPVFRLAMVDKNTPALFDAYVRPGGKIDPEDLAVALVTYQSFAAGGKTGGSEFSESKGKKEPQGGEHALCRDGAATHSFILGGNLLGSVWWNLATAVPSPMSWTRGSRPVWEVEKSQVAEFEEAELKHDYLARLVPLSRAIWLDDQLRNIELASGLHYGVFSDSNGQNTKKVKPGTYIREVSASIQTGNKRGAKPRLVSASAGGVPKGVWRELHAIAVLGKSEKRGGPVALEHLRSHSGGEVRLWCGALVGDQAKVVDTVESVFRLPVSFLEDANAAEVDDPKRHPGPNRTYRQGVHLADDWSERLRLAVKVYRQHLKDADKGGGIQHQAATRYWTALEQKAEPVLLHAVAVRQEGFDPDNKFWMRKSPWGREVTRAARDAYEFACPHATPKQLRAYAEGLRVLFGEMETRTSSENRDEEADSSNEEKS